MGNVEGRFIDEVNLRNVLDAVINPATEEKQDTLITSVAALATEATLSAISTVLTDVHDDANNLLRVSIDGSAIEIDVGPDEADDDSVAAGSGDSPRRLVLSYAYNTGTGVWERVTRTASGLEVDVKASVLPSGAATEAKQDSAITELQSANTSLDSIESDAAAILVAVDELEARIGEISATPTANTVQDRLLAIKTVLDSLDGKDFATEATVATLSTEATLAAVKTVLEDVHDDANNLLRVSIDGSTIEVDVGPDEPDDNSVAPGSTDTPRRLSLDYAYNSTTGVWERVTRTANGLEVEVQSSVLPDGAATEATVSGLLTEATFVAEDFATQTTLASVLTELQAINTDLDVALSTRASETTAAAILAQLDVALSTRASEATVADIDAILNDVWNDVGNRLRVEVDAIDVEVDVGPDEADDDAVAGGSTDTPRRLTLSYAWNPDNTQWERLDARGPLATEAKQDDVVTELVAIKNIDFASETTLAGLRTDFQNEDFASETTLTSVLGAVDEIEGKLDLLRLEAGHGSQRTDPTWVRNSPDRPQLSALSFVETLGALASHQTVWVDVSTLEYLDITSEVETTAAVTALIEFTDAADPNTTPPGVNDIVRPLTTTIGGTALGATSNIASFVIQAQMAWARITVTDVTGGQTVKVTTFEENSPPTGAQIPFDATITGDFRAPIGQTAIRAEKPGGNIDLVAADRDGNLNTAIAAIGPDAHSKMVGADADVFGTGITSPRVNLAEVQFFEDVPSALLDVVVSGGATTSRVEGLGHFNSGTATTASLTATMKDLSQYSSAHELYSYFTCAWNQAPTSASDLALIEWGDDTDGYAIGYKGTDFGIRYVRNGVEQSFTTLASASEDQLDGGSTSIFTRNGTPEAIDPTKVNVFRIRFGWLSAAPTNFEVLAPDGHWVLFHIIKHPNANLSGQTTNPNQPLRVLIDKVASDTTDIEMRMGCLATGIVANVQVAQQPDGDFVSFKADGAVFSYESAGLADGASFESSTVTTSEGIDTDDYRAIEIVIETDQPGTLEIFYTPDVQATSPTFITGPTRQYVQEMVDNGSAVFRFSTALDGFKVKFTNNSGSASTVFNAYSTIRVNAVEPPQGPIEGTITVADNALLNRAIGIGKNPDGVYENLRASGNVASNSTTDLLVANSSFIGDWESTQSFEAISISAISDQQSDLDGVYVEFADDALGTNARTARRETYTLSNVNKLAYYTWHGNLGKFFRVVWENGATGQNTFNLDTFAHIGTTEQTKSPLVGNIGDSTPSVVTRSAIIAENDAGLWDNLTKSDLGGLRISVVEHETDIPIRALTGWGTGQVTITSASPVQIAGTALDGRKTFVFKNSGENDANVFIGPTGSVSESTGFPIAQSESAVIEIDDGAAIWGILSSAAGGSTNQQTLSASATNTNNGALNPDNAFISDNVWMTLDDQNDNVIYDMNDFTFTGSHDTVATVTIGFEGRKVSGTGNKTIGHEETVTNAQTGGTSITTSGSLSAVDGDYYVAFIAVRDQTKVISSVSGLGLTWVQQTQATNSNGIKVAVWTASGTPTAGGAVTANFSSAVTSASIAASRWSGVNSGTPIDSSASNTGSTAAWSATPGTSQSGDRIVGAGAVIVQTTNAPGGDDTEHSDVNLGGSAGERLTLATQSRQSVGAGEPTNGTWAAAGQWAAVAIALNPAPLDDPIVTLSYEVGAEGAGPTVLTQTITSTSDGSFTIDVTGDRTWTDADLDATKLTINLDNVSLDAQIDHVFIDVVEAQSSASQRCAFLEVA